MSRKIFTLKFIEIVANNVILTTIHTLKQFYFNLN